MGIVRTVKALVLEDPFAKGEMFENYVEDLFPKETYTIISKTIKNADLNGRRVEEVENPDYHFRHEPSKYQFWVECKFRSSTSQNKLGWCEQWQLNRYKRFQEERRPEKVFIVAGLGGLCNNPEKLYCIPLDDIDYPDLYLNKIERYRRNPRTPFGYNKGILI